MNRRKVGAIAIIVLATTIIGIITVALMPIWLLALMIYPKMGDRVSDYISKRVMREVTKMMFGSRPNPAAKTIRGK